VVVWRQGAVAAAVEAVAGVVHVALVLEDRPGRLDNSHGAGWQEWLRLSNALGPRDWPTEITTVTLARAAASEPRAGVPAVAPEAPSEDRTLPPAWRELVAGARSEAERYLLRRLAAHLELAPPAIGLEIEGIPVDVCWPDPRIVVELDTMTREDRHDLEEAGWRVAPPDVEQIAAMITAGEAG
jgi:hypothetical protein